jgi:hypothetical protein
MYLKYCNVDFKVLKSVAIVVKLLPYIHRHNKLECFVTAKKYLSSQMFEVKFKSLP